MNWYDTYNMRKATKSELPKLIKWSRSKHNRHVNFEWMLKSREARNYVIERLGKEICCISFNVDEGELIMFMRPRYHFKGYGAVCLAMAEHYISRYFRMPDFFIEPCSEISRKFFRKRGYVPVLGRWWQKTCYVMRAV